MFSRIAVTSRSFSRHPVLKNELIAKYPNVTFNEGNSLRGAALIDFLRGHDAAITALEPLDGSLFDAVPELRTISKYGVGLDMIDITAMRDRDVRLGWTGGVNRRAVSELVIAMVINLLRHIPEVALEVKSGIWYQRKGRQLSKRTFGIVGCGHVGKDLASLLQGFSCRILAHDIRDQSTFYTKNGIESVTLDELLQQSDIVSLHLPLTESTLGIISEEKLTHMRPEALLVNCARGGLVDETALKVALSENRIAGAAFDVFHTEPPDDPDLMGLPNFLATPHIGGSSEEAILAMGRAAIDGLSNATIPDPAGFSNL